MEILKPKLVITSKELKAEFETFNYQGGYILYEDVKPVVEDLDVEKENSRLLIRICCMSFLPPVRRESLKESALLTEG